MLFTTGFLSKSIDQNFRSRSNFTMKSFLPKISKIEPPEEKWSFQNQSPRGALYDGLKILTKFTGKYLYWSLVFSKVAGCRTVIFLKRKLAIGLTSSILRNSSEDCFVNTVG